MLSGRADMKNTKPPLEKSIVNSIIKYLNSLPQCRAIKVSGDAKRSGEPDIDCVYRGQAYKIEVKRSGGKATRLQKAILAKWAAAGAITGVVTSVDEVKELLGEEVIPIE